MIVGLSILLQSFIITYSSVCIKTRAKNLFLQSIPTCQEKFIILLIRDFSIGYRHIPYTVYRISGFIGEWNTWRVEYLAICLKNNAGVILIR